MVRQIPNLFTLLNLVFGCISIILILQVNDAMAYMEEGQLLLQLPENMMLGSLFIFLSAVVDFLDGFIARWLKAASEMGKQLDSLCDAVSFGVAPALIAYQVLRLGFMRQSGATDISVWVLLPALLIACAAVWRLAKFNIDTRQTFHFRGVPTPITAMVFASFPMMLWYNVPFFSELLLQPWFVYVLIFITAFLMISDLPILSLKIGKSDLKHYTPQFMLAGFSVVLLVLFQWAAILMIYILYVLLSLLFRKKIIS
jgi:CDP-diacylglycerol--serine O-phosphatidyltransferase